MTSIAIVWAETTLNTLGKKSGSGTILKGLDFTAEPLSFLKCVGALAPLMLFLALS
jgi:hypothetical protein